MSRLKELLKKYCPNGVEYRRLGEIGPVCMCKRILKSQTNSESGIPFYKIGTFGGVADSFISEELFNEYKSKYSYPKVGDVLISAAGTIGRSVIFNGESSYFQDSNIVWISNDETQVLNKYLFYCYQLSPWSISSGGTIARLYNDNILKAKVPVPPIEVQREIVRILDNFTELTAKLTAELTAELTARKMQYEYYRDALLDVSKEIPVVKLKDIATEMFRGSGIKREEVTEEGIPCVRYGEIYTTYNTWFDTCVSHTKLEYVPSPKYFEHGDILFAITGESVEDIAKSVAYVGHDRCLAGGDIVVMKHKQNPRYLAHVLSTTYAREQKSKGKVKSKVVHSNVPSIENIEIPLPPLDVQERMADVLNNFEKICNDLNIGLPSEIEARQKQYAYYRDHLLSFDSSQFGNVERERERERERAGARRSDEIKLLQYVFGYAIVSLTEICKLVTGATPSKTKREYWENGTIDWMSSGEVNRKKITYTEEKITELGYKSASTTIVPPHSVVIALAGQGKTRGKVAITEIPLCTNQSLCSMICGELTNYKYLYYYLDSRYDDLRAISNGDGTRGGLSIRILEPYKLPLPSMAKQNQIVAILDRFNTLCNDITEGLPAEIEARQKQYEYYRDRLLSFKEN